MFCLQPCAARCRGFVGLCCHTDPVPLTVRPPAVAALFNCCDLSWGPHHSARFTPETPPGFMLHILLMAEATPPPAVRRMTPPQ